MKLAPRSSFPEFQRPKFADSVVFPADVTQLNSVEVSNLMGKYTQMQVWASAYAATLGMRIAETENLLDRIRVSVYAESPSTLSALNKNEREEKLLTYPEVRNTKLKLRSMYAQKAEAESHAECYERFVMVLSRELSRKTANRDGIMFERVK